MSDNNNNNNNSSTLNSYMNQATGLAQRAVGTVTGSTSTQNENTQSQDNAQNSNSGTTDNATANRSNGSWDQTVGSAKESLGNLIGNENLRRQGQEQNADGKAQEAKGQLQDWTQGTSDRAVGAVGSVGAAIKGDREEEEKWRNVHDQGEQRQKSTEDEMDRRYS